MPIRKVIAPFWLDTVGGVPSSATRRRFTYGRPIRMIEIAADSVVEVADLYVGGNADDEATLTRIGVGRPFIGLIPANRLLVLEPVRFGYTIPTNGATTNGFDNCVNPGLNFKLIVNVWDPTEDCYLPHPERRPPCEWYFIESSGAASTPTNYCPVAGRSRLQILCQMGTFSGGGTAATFLIEGIDATPQGGISRTTLATRVLAAGDETVDEYDGVPFDYIAVGVTLDAGTSNGHNCRVTAWDGDL